MIDGVTSKSPSATTFPLAENIIKKIVKFKIRYLFSVKPFLESLRLLNPAYSKHILEIVHEDVGILVPHNIELLPV